MMPITVAELNRFSNDDSDDDDDDDDTRLHATRSVRLLRRKQVCSSKDLRGD
jgi:hypothetical protein